MGYQDRDYYQEEGGPSGFQFGGDLSYTWRLVILNAGLFLANFFLTSDRGDAITDFLSLHGDTAVKPYLWFQFLTYGFVHSADLGHIFWNMVGLVVFGSAIESTYGRREFLRFYLLAILLGGVLWGTRVYLAQVFGWEQFGSALELANTRLVGASGGTMALTLLFCLRYPFATIMLMLVLPVPAWVLGVIYIVGDLLQVGKATGTVAHDVHLAGAAFAVAYFYFQWNLTRAISFGWLTRLGNSLSALAKPRPKLKVYDDDDDDDNAYRELEKEADRILSKISRDGESSLTKQERQTLERYSRLMRQTHR